MPPSRQVAPFGGGTSAARAGGVAAAPSEDRLCAVEDYGAKDNSTNNTLAIQAAIDDYGTAGRAERW